MTTSNVIQFPKTFVPDEDDKVRLPQTEEEVMKAIAVNRMVFVDEVVNQMFSNIATKFYHQGFPVDEELFFKDFIMIGELTRSILYNLTLRILAPAFQFTKSLNHEMYGAR